MTRKEAIKELQESHDMMRSYDVDESESRLMTALNMAIQALSQEPCEVSEYDKDHIWYKGGQYISLRRFLEVKAEAEKEPCDDAISRDAALEKMADYVASGYADSAEDFEEYSRIICQLPSVTPKPETVTEFADRCRECGKMRKGHWIYDQTLNNWRCSKCNETPKIMGYVGTADFMAEHFKFCNHCGAKMESEVQDGDSD